MKNPLVSIIIPTYNSSSNLELVLKSIQKQSYQNLEILIYDANSSDNTIDIAKKYRAKVKINRKQHQVYAKHQGTFEAKGKYIVHLDSDEVLKSKNSIKNKVYLMEKNKEVKACAVSGHETPKNANGANYYINEFGDPFSYFMYGYSFNANFFVKDLSVTFDVVSQNKNYVIFNFDIGTRLPCLELSAAGAMLDRKYLVNNFKKLKKNPYLVSQTFYMILSGGMKVAIMKNDPIIHYSATSWKNYFNKLKARVLNNLYLTDMGKSAFSGRDKYYPLYFKKKKYLYILYCSTFILPAIKGITLAISRKRYIFLMYPFVSLYLMLLMIYFYIAKLIKLKVEIRPYGI